MRSRRLVLIALLVVWLVPGASSGQERCRVLCVPTLSVEPTITFENLGTRARVDTGGTIERAPRATVFELIFALGIPTPIPRVSVTLEASFAPFKATDEQPFTGESAQQTGRDQIRDNPVEIEAELNLHVLDESQTGGWLSSHLDVIDQFSPGELPGDGGVYTHKLDIELDTALHVFNWMPEGRWARNLELELSIDYLASGLPQAGDVIGDQTFLDDASPWSVSLVLVMPLAPLAP